MLPYKKGKDTELTHRRNWYTPRALSLELLLNRIKDFHPTEPWILTTLYSGMQASETSLEGHMLTVARSCPHMVIRFAIDCEDI